MILTPLSKGSREGVDSSRDDFWALGGDWVIGGGWIFYLMDHKYFQAAPWRKKISKNIRGLCTCHWKFSTWGCKFNKGQNAKKWKMALTPSFLMSLFTVFALLQWYTKICNFCILNKKIWSQTKPVAAILRFCKKCISRLQLAVAQHPDVCWSQKGYQTVQ